MNKRILILGASGAMGLYLVPEMLALGWEVDAVFLGESRWPEHPHLHIIQRDVKDAGFLIELLKNLERKIWMLQLIIYIVMFMIWLVLE